MALAGRPGNMIASAKIRRPITDWRVKNTGGVVTVFHATARLRRLE
jgi:hypothetical protein